MKSKEEAESAGRILEKYKKAEARHVVTNEDYEKANREKQMDYMDLLKDPDYIRRVKLLEKHNQEYIPLQAGKKRLRRKQRMRKLKEKRAKKARKENKWKGRQLS